MFERLSNCARRWQEHIAGLKFYHVTDADGKMVSIISTVDHQREPELYAAALRDAARWLEHVPAEKSGHAA
jgi:hypothetical protein